MFIIIERKYIEKAFDLCSKGVLDGAKVNHKVFTNPRAGY
jgi:hypothetical protein